MSSVFNQEAIYIIGAAFVSYTVGLIWNVFFCKFRKDHYDDVKNPQPYLISFIGSLWASYGMFVLIKHIVPKNNLELLAIAVGTWLFVYVGMGARHYCFSTRGYRTFLVDYGQDLISFILISFIVW